MADVKPQAKTKQKKRAILEQALICFSRNGVEGTSIEMLCQATGASVGSLYHHFGNKDAIAAGVFIEGMADFARLVQSYIEPIQSQQMDDYMRAEMAVKALVNANIDWIEQNPDWARFVFQHRSVVKQAGQQDKLNHDIKIFYSGFKDLVGPLIEQGHLQDFPMGLYRSFISGPVHEYARHYLSGRESKPLSDYREQFTQGAWHAIRR